MADLQHSTLQNVKVHEPKHITNTTTVDTGQVITPSSTTNGESELRNLTDEEVGLPLALFQYGIEENTIPISVTAGTIYNAPDYLIVDNTDIQFVEEFNVGGFTFSAANNSVTVPTTGWYYGGSWVTVLTSGTNTVVGFTYSLDGVVDPSVIKTASASADSASSPVNITGYGYAFLTAGQEIQLAIVSDKSTDYTIADLQFSLTLVRKV